MTLGRTQLAESSGLGEASVLRAERSILEHLAQGADLPTLLQEVCALVEGRSDGLLASVLLVADGHLRHGAGSSLPPAYNAAIDGIMICEGTGSCGTAAFRNEQVIVTDIQTDPLWRDFRDLAAAHGLRSCWSTPIGSEREVVGTFAMYYREPREPTPQELALADASAHIARLAIESHRTDAERRELVRRAEALAITNADLATRAEDQTRTHVALNAELRSLVEERDRAMAEAHAERGRLRDLIMQAPALIAILRGPQHIFELANPLYEQLVGQRQLIGKSVADALPEVIEQGFIGLLDHVYASGEPFIGREVPAHLTNADGTRSEVFVNFVYQPSRGPDGAVEGILVHAVDVSDLVRAREAEARSADRFRTLAETMPQKIFTAVPNGEVDYFNPPWTEFTGLSFEQIRAWGWIQFIHPDDVDENVRVWQQSLDHGEPFQFQHRFRRADGEYRWHLSRAHAVRDASGAIVMWIGSNTDIDDQKRAADLVQETLSLRDEFLSAAAHDLKTPLTALKGHVQLVRRRLGDDVAPGIKQSLDQVDLAATRMAGLVDELLEIARIDAGQTIELSRRETDFVALVNAVAEAAAQQARQQNVVVEADSPRLLGHWDPARLERVVTNLLSNAIKYTPAGGTILLATKRERTDVRQWAVLRVQDEGIGIPEQDMSRLFTRFHRGSNVRGLAGTGIGLDAVRRIVEMHGGTIRVDSREGAGSVFTVRLPIE